MKGACRRSTYVGVQMKRSEHANEKEMGFGEYGAYVECVRV